MEHHGAGLRRLTGNEKLVKDLSGEDPLSADISPSERELIRYALKLSSQPASIGRQDIEALRQVGWDDRAIHDACNVVSYYHYVNRVADGLGVELEEPSRPSGQSAPP